MQLPGADAIYNDMVLTIMSEALAFYMAGVLHCRTCPLCHYRLGEFTGAAAAVGAFCDTFITLFQPAWDRGTVRERAQQFLPVVGQALATQGGHPRPLSASESRSMSMSLIHKN